MRRALPRENKKFLKQLGALYDTHYCTIAETEITLMKGHNFKNNQIVLTSINGRKGSVIPASVGIIRRSSLKS